MPTLNDDELATVAAFNALVPDCVVSLTREGLGWTALLSDASVVISSTLGDALQAARVHDATEPTDTAPQSDPPCPSPA